MSHFAEIDQDNIVVRVIVAEQDFINSGAVGDPRQWIQTSYNTQGGQHLLGGTALRKIMQVRATSMTMNVMRLFHLDPTTVGS